MFEKEGNWADYCKTSNTSSIIPTAKPSFGECMGCSPHQWKQYLFIFSSIIALPLGLLLIFKSLYNPKNAYLSAYSSIIIDYMQFTAILSLSFRNFDKLG